jgi:hypothetical protein
VHTHAQGHKPRILCDLSAPARPIPGLRRIPADFLRFTARNEQYHAVVYIAVNMAYDAMPASTVPAPGSDLLIRTMDLLGIASISLM